MRLWQVFGKVVRKFHQKGVIDTFYTGVNFALDRIVPEIVKDFADWIKKNEYVPFDMEGVSAWLKVESGERVLSTELFKEFLKTYEEKEELPISSRIFTIPEIPGTDNRSN